MHRGRSRFGTPSTLRTLYLITTRSYGSTTSNSNVQRQQQLQTCKVVEESSSGTYISSVAVRGATRRRILQKSRGFQNQAQLRPVTSYNRVHANASNPICLAASRCTASSSSHAALATRPPFHEGSSKPRCRAAAWWLELSSDQGSSYPGR